jgi:hypothetical protein
VDPLARQNNPVLGLAQQHLSKLSPLAVDVENHVLSIAKEPIAFDYKNRSSAWFESVY